MVPKHPPKACPIVRFASALRVPDPEINYFAYLIDSDPHYFRGYLGCEYDNDLDFANHERLDIARLSYFLSLDFFRNNK